jgi:hypothetical protein
MAGSFTAQVNAFVQKTRVRQLAVFRESAQRTIALAQTPVSEGGNLPVKTGFMRASLRVSLDGSLPSLTGRPDGVLAVPYDAGEVGLVIANANLDAKITAGYGANYAVYQEYGSQGRAGRRFVALAAQQWPRIVGEVAAELQGRVQGAEAARVYQAGG